MFYSSRVVDIPDGKPKWDGMNKKSDLIEDSPPDLKRKREEDKESWCLWQAYEGAFWETIKSNQYTLRHILSCTQALSVPDQNIFPGTLYLSCPGHVYIYKSTYNLVFYYFSGPDKAIGLCSSHR